MNTAKEPPKPHWGTAIGKPAPHAVRTPPGCEEEEVRMLYIWEKILGTNREYACSKVQSHIQRRFRWFGGIFGEAQRW